MGATLWPLLAMAGGTVKIFKKCAPNGRVYIYMGKREFVSIDGVIEPIKGVVHIQDYKDTLKGRRVYVQLVIIFRHGREDDETMGLSFKKELILDRTQIYPPESRAEESKLQSRLLQKLGDGAIPFTLEFPDLAPNSVLICAEAAKPCIHCRKGLHVWLRKACS